jgi:hypothetical protein
MRTGLFLLAGLLLLGASGILARLFSQAYPGASSWSTGTFLAVWLALAGFNLWVGVSKAGYSVRDELPIFLVLFAIPAIAAGVVRWKLL